MSPGKHRNRMADGSVQVVFLLSQKLDFPDGHVCSLSPMALCVNITTRNKWRERLKDSRNHGCHACKSGSFHTSQEIHRYLFTHVIRAAFEQVEGVGTGREKPREAVCGMNLVASDVHNRVSAFGRVAMGDDACFIDCDKQKQIEHRTRLYTPMNRCSLRIQSQSSCCEGRRRYGSRWIEIRNGSSGHKGGECDGQASVHSFVAPTGHLDIKFQELQPR